MKFRQDLQDEHAVLREQHHVNHVHPVKIRLPIVSSDCNSLAKRTSLKKEKRSWSVSRVLLLAETSDDHFSRPAIANRLEQPTRKS